MFFGDDSPVSGPILTPYIYIEREKMLRKLSASSVRKLLMCICASIRTFPIGRIMKLCLKKKFPVEAVSISLKFYEASRRSGITAAVDP